VFIRLLGRKSTVQRTFEPIYPVKVQQINLVRFPGYPLNVEIFIFLHPDDWSISIKPYFVNHEDLSNKIHAAICA
jgi:hypothetical protein